MDIGLLQAGLEGILQVLENFCLQDRSCGRPRHQRALLRLAQAAGHLTGEIPPELGNLSNLTRLDLSFNQLTGCVPSGLSGRLDMDNSNLGGLQFCQ